MSWQDLDPLRHFSRDKMRSLTVLLPLALGTLVSLLFWLTLAIIFSGTNSSTKFVYSGRPGPEDFVIFLNVSELGNPDFAKFDLSAVDFPMNNLPGASGEDKLCIESLVIRSQPRNIESQPQYQTMSRESLATAEWLEFGSAHRRSSIPEGLLVSPRNDICYAEWDSPTRGYPTYPGGSIVGYGEQPRSVNLPIQVTRDVYYYPFDRREVSSDIQLEGGVGGATDARRMPFEVSASIVSSEWDELVRFERNVHSDSGNEELQMTIELRRPLPKQILVSVLIITMTAFVFLLNYIRDTANYLEVAVGITLGLWGIQAAMKPQFITQNTIIDDAILVIYLLLAMTVLVRFIIQPLAARTLAANDAHNDAQDPDRNVEDGQER